LRKLYVFAYELSAIQKISAINIKNIFLILRASDNCRKYRKPDNISERRRYQKI